MINVAICQPSPLLQDALEAGVRSQPDMRLLHLTQLGEDESAVLVWGIDAEDPEESIERLACLLEERPGFRAVATSGCADPRLPRRAQEAGASAFTLADRPIGEHLALIRNAGAGYELFPRQGDTLLEALDEEEAEVVRLACLGLDRQEISRLLYVSEGTTKRIIGRILAKTGYPTLGKLALAALARHQVAPTLGSFSYTHETLPRKAS